MVCRKWDMVCRKWDMVSIQCEVVNIKVFMKCDKDIVPKQELTRTTTLTYHLPRSKPSTAPKVGGPSISPTNALALPLANVVATAHRGRHRRRTRSRGCHRSRRRRSTKRKPLPSLLQQHLGWPRLPYSQSLWSPYRHCPLRWWLLGLHIPPRM